MYALYYINRNSSGLHIQLFCMYVFIHVYCMCLCVLGRFFFFKTGSSTEDGLELTHCTAEDSSELLALLPLCPP